MSLFAIGLVDIGGDKELEVGQVVDRQIVLVFGALDGQFAGDETEDGFVGTDIETGGDIGGYGFDLSESHYYINLYENINFCGFFQYLKF